MLTNLSDIQIFYLFIYLSVLLGCICRESVEGRYVPNEGFLEDVVFGHPSLLSPPSHDTDLAEASGETSNGQQNNTKSDEAEGSLDVNELPADSSHTSTRPNSDGNTADEITAGMGDLKLPDSGSPNEPNDQHTLSTSDVDLLLDKCLLQALHTTLKDKDLPIPGSTLW